MKQNFILLAIGLIVAISAEAQDKFIKVDTNIGAAMTFGELNSFGISAAAEPKFFINPQLAVGLRLEGAVLFAGSVSGDQEFDIGLSSRAAQLLKAEYYFGEDGTRPFAGLMTGRYVQANIGSSSQGEASITAGTFFGFAPEIGITFNNFRLSAIYHVVPGTDLLVGAGVGSPPEISRNYMVIQLGFKVFQYDL